ncbi:hypothetical protein [Corynebacterium diphtheriae]|uniref:hypothetical protein n=1 Tax=Corynebacterium diphtheriae TaxID=1717 RepID=UPI0008FB7FAA|nr:hypothetical protein [Corynebacterium diphtheriae]OIR65207.1 hypothetical protein BHF73_02030 [Corynebacterium diphtheriae]OIR65425.1 hypothetical protein BHF76_10660 [Corynebacterium diphtheriae]OIR69294.1 hypothetical protein BHF77_02975 [Corynebacterium diphtheriae]OIR72765.1 hypothetical protein BHF78_09680 [Corynebacterium diphtheriae]OIR80496.1 hypothetical protein BHF81_07385 [Corynebacterium diphtheriae]
MNWIDRSVALNNANASRVPEVRTCPVGCVVTLAVVVAVTVFVLRFLMKAMKAMDIMIENNKWDGASSDGK